jgi:hypothetical protein
LARALFPCIAGKLWKISFIYNGLRGFALPSSGFSPSDRLGGISYENGRKFLAPMLAIEHFASGDDYWTCGNAWFYGLGWRIAA